MSNDLKAIVEMLAGRPLLNRKDLARRYGKDLDTIDRWHRARILPQGVYLPGCRYPFWRPVDVERNESSSKFRKTLKK
jgi:hypothetical protein